MRTQRMLLNVLLAVGLVMGFALSCSAQEIRVTAKKVPPAVLAAFKAAYPNATVRGYSREKEHGKVFYEVESIEGDLHRDVLYHPDGTVSAVEESMPVADVPNEVQESMRKSYPKAIVTSAEKIMHDGVTEYELQAKMGRKRIEVKFDAAGKVLAVE
jgi:uncharacterized membrane protein YkoI